MTLALQPGSIFMQNRSDRQRRKNRFVTADERLSARTRARTRADLPCSAAEPTVSNAAVNGTVSKRASKTAIFAYSDSGAGEQQPGEKAETHSGEVTPAGTFI